MQWSDIPFKPDRKTLRQFAGLWLVFFGGMAIWQSLVRGQTSLGLSLGALALVVGVAGLIATRVGAPDLRRLDGPGLPDRLDGLAGDAAPDVLGPVRADRPDLPPHRPRRAPSRQAARGRIVLDSQTGPGRCEELLQAIPWTTGTPASCAL